MRPTIDGKSETAPLTVKMDPRVHMSQSELESLHAAQTTMAASLDALAKADLEAQSVMEQMNADQDKIVATQLAAFHVALKTIVNGTEGGVKPDAPKAPPGIGEVTAEANQLYGELEQADANPTAALLAAAAHVQEEEKEVLPGWENFKQTQIPEMNRNYSVCIIPQSSRMSARPICQRREMRISHRVNKAASTVPMLLKIGRNGAQ